MKKKFPGLINTILIVLIIFVAVIALGSRYISSRLFSNIESSLAEIETYYPQITADLQVLEQKPLFEDRERIKNAEPLISKYVAWEGFGAKKLENENHATLLKFIQDHPSKKLGDEYLKELYSDPRLMNLDVAWVDTLQEYDHWNFASHPSWIETLKKVSGENSIGRVVLFSNLAIPDMKEFRFSVLIRFLQLHRQGKTEKGLKAIRNAAQLCHSTGTLIGSMVALTLLRDEINLAEVLHQTSWKPATNDSLEAYKRVAWAWNGIFNVNKWKGFPSQFEAFLKPRNGICGAAWENSVKGLPDLLSGGFPFESSYKEQVERDLFFQRKMLEACGLQAMAVFLEPVKPENNPVMVHMPVRLASLAALDNTPPDPNRVGLNPTRIPFFRVPFGMLLSTVAQPNAIRFYKERASADKGK